jgi:putative hydrolase of HD superfamily
MELDELEKFFRDVNELKHSEREGWKQIGVEQPRDTIASHSFGASLLGWIFAEEEDLDSEKFTKMLLVHDLIMAYVDDYTPEDEEFESKDKKELENLEKLVEDVPEIIEDEFEDLVREFMKQETEEAKLAKECDKLETLLQARSYSEKLGKDHLSEFLDSYSGYFESDTGKEVFSQLEAEAEKLGKEKK